MRITERRADVSKTLILRKRPDQTKGRFFPTYLVEGAAREEGKGEEPREAVKKDRRGGGQENEGHKHERHRTLH